MEELQLMSHAGSLWADPYHDSVSREHWRGVRVPRGTFDHLEIAKLPSHPLSVLQRKLPVASVSSGGLSTHARILPVRSQPRTHEADHHIDSPHADELPGPLPCVLVASGERRYDQSKASTAQNASSTSLERGEKRVLVDRLMQWVDFALASCASPAFRHRGTGGRPGAAFSGFELDQKPQGVGSVRPSREGARPPGRKRLPEDDDGDDEGDGPKRRRVRPESGDAPSRLACPYFKRDPRQYRLSRSCPGPGWATVHRVKEHLYRCHRLPIHCLYCHEVFECDRLLQNHLRADQPCKVLDLPPLEGVDASQEKLLRSRKKTHKDWSEAEKWVDAYRILFPRADAANIPSPCQQPLQRGTAPPTDERCADFEADYDYSMNEEDSQVNTSSDLESFEQYLKEELPKTVRRALEARVDQAVNPVEETLRDQIVDIVRDCQTQLFEDYRASRTRMAGPAARGAISPAKETGDDSDGEQDATQPGTVAVGSQSQQDHPDYYFDSQFDGFNEGLFDFTDMNFDQEWDSGYGSSTMTDVVTPDLHKAILVPGP